MNRGKPNSKFQAGGFAALLALIAFGFYALKGAYGFGESSRSFLLSFSFFRENELAAILVAAALCAAFIAGLFFFYEDHIRDFARHVLKLRFFAHVVRNRVRYAQLVVCASIGLSISTLISGVYRPVEAETLDVAEERLPAAKIGETKNSGQEVERRDSKFQGRFALSSEWRSSISPMPSILIETVAAEPPDVCGLKQEFSNDELRACIADIKKNPDREGLGGRIYSREKVGNRWVIKPERMLPPPLDIKPKPKR